LVDRQNDLIAFQAEMKRIVDPQRYFQQEKNEHKKIHPVGQPPDAFPFLSPCICHQKDLNNDADPAISSGTSFHIRY
jgi:hypothetical protein